ncbi:MAG: hypothetical protein JWM76_189 [Pseudonocardiales bacterium]|nr:hypothetical protein [Pseudonocardiales bacterium]
MRRGGTQTRRGGSDVSADILHKKDSELTDADEKHMTKVVGLVHRHLAQRPDGVIRQTTWRYSLMNWGHDPTK